VPNETLIYSPQLDDRLGVYTILDLMPSLGVKMDALLTDDEEIGRSTASLFATDKQYNWIVEFDRRGTGAVMYEYDFPCHDYFDIERGTFSDICELEHLGCQGINIGVAYHKEHTTRCHMVLEDYAEQMVRFQTMWTDLHKTKMEHEPLCYDNGGWYDDKHDYGVEFCDNCNQAKYTYELVEIDQSVVCEDCYDEMLETELSILNGE